MSSRGDARRGFTLIELLIVVMIVGLLATFLIAGLWPQKEKALQKNTAALIESIKTALDQYYGEFRDYPPDGYDSERGWKYGPAGTVGNGAITGANPVGLQLGTRNLLYYGTGSLIYFLCYPISNITIVGTDATDPRNVRNNPCNKGGAFLTTLKKENFSVWFYDNSFSTSFHPGHPNYRPEWAKCEIVDAYGWPLHYDKVGQRVAGDADTANFQASRFRSPTPASPPTGIHSDDRYFSELLAGRIASDEQRSHCPTDQHTVGGTGGLVHADPRAPLEPDGCIIDNPTQGTPNKPVPRNPGAFDLWSHGKSWANGITAISNWK